MNYAPAVPDQRASIIMQGLGLQQRAAELLGGYGLSEIQRARQAAGARSAIEALAGYGQDNTSPDLGAASTPPAGTVTTPIASYAPGVAPYTGLPGFDPNAGAGAPALATAGANAGPNPLEARGQKADAIRRLVTTYAPGSQTALKGMGLEQLEGILKAYTLHSAMQENQARMAYYTGRAQDYDAQAALRNQEAADDATVGTAVNRYATTPIVPIDPTGEADGFRQPTPQERMSAALSTPGLSGRNIPRLIDSLSKYGQTLTGTGAAEAEALKPTSYEDPDTGARFLLYGKQALSTGFNPAKNKPQFIAQHDTDNNLLGWSQVDAKGHSTFTPYKGAQLKAAKDEQGDPIPGWYITADGKPINTNDKGGVDQLINYLKTKANAGKPNPVQAGPAAAAGPLPFPKGTPAEQRAALKKGQLYQTARGPATWDGSQFNPTP